MVLVSGHVLPLFTALSMDEAPYLMALPVALVGLLIPVLSLILEPHRWVLAGICAGAGLVVLGMAVSAHGFDGAHPQPSFLVYGVDADDDSAVWATRSRARELQRPDPWARQVFSGELRSDTLKFYPWSADTFLQTDAPQEDLAPPTAELLDETSGPGGRTLRLRVRSPRSAPIVLVVADRPVMGWSVGELPVSAKQILGYWGVPEDGFELTLKVGDTDPLKLVLIDESYGLPEEVPERPAAIMAEPSGGLIFTDATLVRTSYSF
jgi:hypothetical protein